MSRCDAWWEAEFGNDVKYLLKKRTNAYLRIILQCDRQCDRVDLSAGLDRDQSWLPDVYTGFMSLKTTQSVLSP